MRLGLNTGADQAVGTNHPSMKGPWGRSGRQGLTGLRPMRGAMGGERLTWANGMSSNRGLLKGWNN